MNTEDIKIAKQIVEAAIIAAGFKVGSSVHWPKSNSTQAFSVKSIPNTHGHPVAIAEIRNGVFTVTVDN